MNNGMLCPACHQLPAMADPRKCAHCGGLGRVGARPYELRMTAPNIAPSQVVELIKRHPTPWRIEEDWTYEVLDAHSVLVVKCMTAVEAMLFLKKSEECDL